MATEARARPTARTGNASPRLSDEQLQEMMALLRGADSTELKVTIPYEQQFATVRGLLAKRDEELEFRREVAEDRAA